MNREDAYAWLSKRLGIPRFLTHVGMFDERNVAELLNCAKRMRRKKEYVVSDETADRYISLVVLPGEDYMDSYRCTERQYHTDMR